MIRSMTGFGSASVDSEALRATATVRCLNHRFLDVNIQTSRGLRSLEPQVRERLRARVVRGRVDVSIQAVFQEGGVEQVVASRHTVEGVVRALREIESHYGLEGGVRVSDVARFPGALEVEALGALGEAQGARILELVDQALVGLDQMRHTEGESLARHLEEALAAIAAATGRIRELAVGGVEERREALLEKARTLKQELGLDEVRLHQEVVRLVDRQDVTEELKRLESHVAQARGCLASEAACGKTLDFLAQELTREANTIGSKAVSAAVVQEVVALKSEIERLREQVQNVE
jgi:uncharacterized protein (TIGR00255 family)